MQKEENPFRYLKQEEFLRLSEAERLAYLEHVTKHLAELTSQVFDPTKRAKKF